MEGDSVVMGRIMVVDDTLFMRGVLKEMLISNGHEVVAEGCNGLEAVHLYKMVKPDLVTLDITMPVMDGLAALTEIMKIDPRAKVIMCSAMGQRQIVLDAIKIGARDFVVKPFNKERVTEAINNALA